LANGTVTDGGDSTVTTRGFCYKAGIAGDPTTADSEVHDNEDDIAAYALSIVGLLPETGYRVRAYAINTQGTSYGDTVQVTTQAQARASFYDYLGFARRNRMQSRGVSLGVPGNPEDMYVLSIGPIVLSVPAVPTVTVGTSVKGYTEISDVAISIASPCVVTSAGHGIVDDEIIKFTTTGALPTGLTAFTYYYCNYIDVDTFNVSTAPDGDNINTSGSQSGTQSVWHET
jgi:hypothetical protein